MTEEKVMEIFSEAMNLAFKLAGPLLIISMAIGLIIAIFQAATQIHEQTLTFTPKAVLIALVLLVLGPWMINELIDFMNYIFALIADVGFN